MNKLLKLRQTSKRIIFLSITEGSKNGPVVIDVARGGPGPHLGPPILPEQTYEKVQAFLS